MKRSDKINTEKIHNKKKKNDIKHEVSDSIRKETLAIITSVRTNIYQKIYRVLSSSAEDWRKFDFLSSDKKIETFIASLEREIKNVRSEKFNFEKYKKIIGVILGMDTDKFKEEIVKNMYIAKLQNIIFLLKNNNEDGDVKEVKETKQDIMR